MTFTLSEANLLRTGFSRTRGVLSQGVFVSITSHRLDVARCAGAACRCSLTIMSRPGSDVDAMSRPDPIGPIQVDHDHQRVRTVTVQSLDF